jgi:hypothetical protein
MTCGFAARFAERLRLSAERQSRIECDSFPPIWTALDSRRLYKIDYPSFDLRVLQIHVVAFHP